MVPTNIFCCLMALNFKTTDVSAHKTFSDVPDEQLDSKYRPTPHKPVHGEYRHFPISEAINICDPAHGHFPMYIVKGAGNLPVGM